MKMTPSHLNLMGFNMNYKYLHRISSDNSSILNHTKYQQWSSISQKPLDYLLYANTMKFIYEVLYSIPSSIIVFQWMNFHTEIQRTEHSILFNVFVFHLFLLWRELLVSSTTGWYFLSIWIKKKKIQKTKHFYDLEYFQADRQDLKKKKFHHWFWQASAVNIWYRNWSFMHPSTNSFLVNTPSLFKSILSNIFSVRSAGVSSSLFDKFEPSML